MESLTVTVDRKNSKELMRRIRRKKAPEWSLIGTGTDDPSALKQL